MKILKLGFLDSGIGGLNVLKKFLNYKNLELIYVSSKKNLPFGEKTENELAEIISAQILFLLKNQVDYIIVACTTATVLILKILIEKFSTVKFIFGCDIGIKEAIKKTKSNKIGVLSTRFVAENKFFTTCFSSYKSKNLIIFEYFSKKLALLVEKKANLEIKLELESYVKNFKVDKIDTLILSSTHYRYFYKELKKMVPYIKILLVDYHFYNFKKILKKEKKFKLIKKYNNEKIKYKEFDI